MKEFNRSCQSQHYYKDISAGHNWSQAEEASRLCGAFQMQLRSPQEVKAAD